MTTERRIPIETAGETNHNFNVCRDQAGGDNNNINDQRKPSYVGLACAVSGYSDFIRYTSPDRKTTPPQQFKVQTEPQILDSLNLNMRQQQNNQSPPVRGQGQDSPDLASYYTSSHTRKIVQNPGGLTTVETVTKFYNNNNINNGLRETSPGGSDTSSVGSDRSFSSGGGNLVQKQIERLYGGKMTLVRSPEPKSDDSSPENENGFFGKAANRSFGSTNNADHSNESSPLDLKSPLKVPAVFRLLRPEFRDLLKSNSCQVQIPNGSNGSSPQSAERVIPIRNESSERVVTSEERVIPISVESKQVNGNRVIPVVRDETPKRAPPASTNEYDARRKKTDITKNIEFINSSASNGSSPAAGEKPALPAKPVSPIRSPPTVPKNSTPAEKSEDFSSPKLVSSVLKKEQPQTKTFKEEVIEEVAEAEEELEDEDEELLAEYPTAGVRERTLLCPIQEEDTESTASGSSVSIRKPVISEEKTNTTNTTDVIQEEIRDGHYFIKILENEIFKFEEQICDFEEEDLSNIPDEEIRDSILAAVGKAKLLMSQKLTQFRGLCDKNINSNPQEDPYVPTSEDLAGFWDMVYIQVEHIHTLFAELSTIRQNGWRRPQQQVPKTNGTASKKVPENSKAQNKSKTSTTKAKSGVKSEAAKARDEARKKMLEEKKRLMKQKQKQNGDSDDIIFCS
jgi:hypothetical protein